MKRKNKNGIRESINKHVKDVISETVKRQSIKNATNCITEDIMKRLTNSKLNEEYYPEDDDMIDDYYYGMMATLSIEGITDGDLTEEVIQDLINTREEYCDNSNSYCSVMVTKVDVQRDEFNDFDIKVEVAVSAPEMPIRAIEEDTEEQVWYWFENKTNTRAIRVEFIDEREVFDRRRKYKTQQLKESIGHNDYGSISNALEECGWSYVDAYEVKNRTTGQKGTRYVIEPYGTDSCGTDEIKQQMIQLIGKDNVVFSEGRSVTAPEIKKLSMIVIDK